MHRFAFFTPLTCAIVIAAGAMDIPATAAENGAAPQPTAAPTPWNVRVEVLMAGMPLERFITLLPDLRDEAKIDAAVAQIQEAVKKKEMILRGAPSLVIRSGVNAVSETVPEKRYPTETIVPGGADKETLAMASAFETRNTGVSLEATGWVSELGKWIDLDLMAQDVEIVGFDSFSPTRKHGAPVKAGEPVYATDQPQFLTMRTTCKTSVRNGRRILLGVHKMAKPEGYMEVFILRATAAAAGPATETALAQAAQASLDSATASEAKGDYNNALLKFQEAAQAGSASGYSGVARILALCPLPAVRDGTKAVAYARKACELGGWFDGGDVHTLAAAYSESGDIARAVEYEARYLDLPQRPESPALASDATRSEAGKKYPGSGANSLLSRTTAEVLAEMQKAGSPNHAAAGSSLAPLIAADIAARQIQVATRRKFQDLIIPKVSFRGATVQKVLEYLNKQIPADDSSNGMGIVLKAAPEEGGGAIKLGDVRLTLDLKNIPIIECLRYVCDLSAVHYVVNLDHVDIVPLSITPESVPPVPDPAH